MDRSDGSLKPHNPDSDREPPTDLPAQLAQLDTLHRSDALTDSEYTAAKAKLLP